MASEQVGSGIIAALIACLSVGILLLGIQLSSALREEARLSPVGSGVLVGAALLLYTALAWRGSRGKGGGTFARWWVTMLVGHIALGVTVALANAALASSPADVELVARSAGAASLPMVVLQAGYSVGVSSLAWGDHTELGARGAPAVDLQDVPVAEIEARPPVMPMESKPEPAGERAPHLEIYANAIERLRASDHATLVRFATQAAKCDGGLLATRDGLVVAAVEPQGWETARVAAVLPELVRDLEALGGQAPTMLHAALGGHELLAVPGRRLTGCLIGPKAGAREAAEVILPVLVARAEELQMRELATDTEEQPGDHLQSEQESLP